MADGAELLTQEEKAQIAQVSGQVSGLVERAGGLAVRTQGEAEAAAEFLGGIVAQKRTAEKIRLFLVTPLKQHAAAIDAMFKPNRDSLEVAEGMIKQALTAFQREQEEARRREQERLDAERREAERAEAERVRKAEAEAQSKREAAAREAAAAEEAARRSERERLEAMELDQQSRRARIGRLSEDMLARLAGGEGEDAEMAQAEIAGRQRAREAQEAVARAAEAEDAARAAEAEARATPPQDVVPVVAAGPGKLSGITSRKVWKFEVADFAQVPDRFKVVDEKAIREFVKDGGRELAGVRIFQDSNLAVR